MVSCRFSHQFAETLTKKWLVFPAESHQRSSRKAPSGPNFPMIFPSLFHQLRRPPSSSALSSEWRQQAIRLIGAPCATGTQGSGRMVGKSNPNNGSLNGEWWIIIFLSIYQLFFTRKNRAGNDTSSTLWVSEKPRWSLLVEMTRARKHKRRRSFQSHWGGTKQKTLHPLQVPTVDFHNPWPGNGSKMKTLRTTDFSRFLVSTIINHLRIGVANLDSFPFDDLPDWWTSSWTIAAAMTFQQGFP